MPTVRGFIGVPSVFVHPGICDVSVTHLNGVHFQYGRERVTPRRMVTSGGVEWVVRYEKIKTSYIFTTEAKFVSLFGSEDLQVGELYTIALVFDDPTMTRVHVLHATLCCKDLKGSRYEVMRTETWFEGNQEHVLILDKPLHEVAESFTESIEGITEVLCKAGSDSNTTLQQAEDAGDQGAETD